MRRRVTRWQSILLLLATSVSVASMTEAQVWTGGATLGVSVKSSKGTPIQSALVTVAYRDIGFGDGPSARQTNSNGEANFTGISVGTWSLKIDHPDFLSYLATIVVRQGKKPQILTEFLEATGAGRLTMKVKPLKGVSDERGSPVQPVIAQRPSSPPDPRLPEAAPSRVTPPPTDSGPPPPELSTGVEAVEGHSTRDAPEIDSSASMPPTESPGALAQDALVEGTADGPPATTEPQQDPVVTETAEQLSESTPSTGTSARAVVGGTTETHSDSGPDSGPDSTPAPGPVPETDSDAGLTSDQISGPSPKIPLQTGSPTALPTEADEVTVPEAAALTPELDVPPAPVPAADQQTSEHAPQLETEPVLPTVSPIAEAQLVPESVPSTPTERPDAPPTVDPEPAPPATKARRLITDRESLRSYKDRTCFECKPGEWSVVSSITVSPAGTDSCSTIEEDRIRPLMEAFISSDVNRFAGYAGPLPAASSDVPPDLQVLSTGSCRLVALILPRSARFTGFRFQASDTDGGDDCLADQECAIGSARWLFNPAILRNDEATIIFSVFQNSSSDQNRAAKLIAYFVPSGRWVAGL